MTRQITFIENARDEQNVQRRRGDSVTVSDAFADYEVNAGRAVYVGQQTLDARLSINGTSLVDGAGNALPRPSSGLNVIAFGDSITGRNYRTASGDADQGQISARGYLAVAQMICANRINILGVGDHSGGAVTAPLGGNLALGDYVATEVTPYARYVDAVIFGGGINDITTVGVTDAVLIAALRAVFLSLRNTGCGHIGINLIMPTTGTTATQMGQISRINDFIVRECRLYSQMTALDFAGAIGNAQTGLAKTGMTTDGTHPSPRGAMYMAQRVVKWLNTIPSAAESAMSGSPYDSLSYGPNPLAQGANASGTNKWVVNGGGGSGTGPATWTGWAIGTATVVFTGAGTYPASYARDGSALGFDFTAVAANDSFAVYAGVDIGGSTYGTFRTNLNWAATQARTFGQLLNPSTGNNGFLYKCVTYPGGTGSGSEPSWPLVLGNTVVDGAVTWVCIENLSAGEYVQFEADFLLTASTLRLLPSAEVKFLTSGFAGVNPSTLNFGSPVAVINSGMVSSPRYVAGEAQFDAASPQLLPLNQVLRIVSPVMVVPATAVHFAAGFRLFGEVGATATGQILRMELKKVKTY